MNREFVNGSNFFREMSFERIGDAIPTHRHNFGHTTFIVFGSALCQELVEDPNGEIELLDGQVFRRFRVAREILKKAERGRAWVYVKPGTWHRFVAVEPHTLAYCVFAHHTPQGNVVETYDGWSPAYE